MKSETTGNFAFVNLVPAEYKVEVQAANFKRFLRERLSVTVGSAIRIETVLEIGASTETVEVTTQAPLLQTESGQLGQQVEGTTVQEMPLNGRNTMALIALTAGVVPQGASLGATSGNQNSGNTNNNGWGNYQIGGGIAGQSAQYIDGVAVNMIGNAMSLVPTQDAVQEFSVASNAISADFGRFAGGVVNMTTKSGSNQWHGSVYEYLRNTVLNGNDWFNKKNQLLAKTANKPPKFNQNQYGVAVSGPVLRDKVFFMFSWEGYNVRQGQPSPTFIPTTDMKKKFYLPYLYKQGAVITPIDPSGHCVPVQNTAGAYWDVSGCSPYFSKAGLVFQEYYPDTNTGSSTYYYRSVNVGTNTKQYNGRIDYNLSSNQRIFGRYSFWDVSDISFNQFPENTKYNVGNGMTKNKTYMTVLGDTYTFNPTTILDARLSWTRQQYNTDYPVTNADESQFFGSAGFISQEQVHLLPTFGLNNQRGFYTSWSRGAFGQMYMTNWQISASLTKIAGNHSFKAGTELRLMDLENSGTKSSGTFNFAGSGGASYTGDEWLDLLLGYPSGGSLAMTNWTAAYNYYQAYYLQDTWQYSKRLTLSLGLRYELPGSLAERNDKATVLMPNFIDPYTGVKGTLGLVNSPMWGRRTVSNPPRRAIGPRVSFAYRLSNNTALRGGYGVSYLAPDLALGGASRPGGSTVNTASTAISQLQLPTAANITSGAFTTMVNPFPNGLLSPTGNSAANFMVSRLFNTAIAGALPTEPFPYMQQWNLSLSHQFNGELMVETGYAGSKGTHLPALNGGMDEINSSWWNRGTAVVNGSTVNDNTVKDCQLTTTAPGGATYTTTTTRGRCRQPYPYYSNFTQSNASWAASNYNSLQVKVQKRFKSGGLIMGSYTWAKMIGDTDTANNFLEAKSTSSDNATGYGAIQDLNNHRGEHSILSYNTPNRVVVSYVIPLPFGEGQKYWSGVHGLAGRLVSGWAINGITSFQSGFAMQIKEAATYSITSYGAGTVRSNYAPSGSAVSAGDGKTYACNSKKTLSGSSRDRLGAWFNIGCFAAPGADANGTAPPSYIWALGSEPRIDGSVQSQGIDNWDISFVKQTKIWERSAVDFRGEFFNIFNRTQFGPPFVQRGNAQFGQILSQGNKPRLVQFSLRVKF